MTILPYELSPLVKAFSTTRISPCPISPEEEKEMGDYAAFNVTDYCGDNLERVKRNRDYLTRELHIEESALWLPRQTHTVNIRVIDEATIRLEEKERKPLLENVDALVTNVPRQCIGVSTADCVPILLVDERQKAVAAIHAGWRGTLAEISVKTVETMKAAYDTRPEDLKALLGPSISAEAYEVGEDLTERFLAAGFPAEIISYKKGPTGNLRPHLDLWAANTWLLEKAGLSFERIAVSGICTYLHADTFFSARRLGIESGRIFTAIMLNE